MGIRRVTLAVTQMPETPRQPMDLPMGGHHTTPAHGFIHGEKTPHEFIRGKKKTIHLHLILYTFRQSSEQAALWEQFIQNTQEQSVVNASPLCPQCPLIFPLW